MPVYVLAKKNLELSCFCFWCWLLPWRQLRSNTKRSWQVRFLWRTREVPGIIVLFLTAAAGFFAGITVALPVKRGTKPQP